MRNTTSFEKKVLDVQKLYSTQLDIVQQCVQLYTCHYELLALSS